MFKISKFQYQEVICTAIVALHSFLLFRYAANNSYFTHDDYLHFYETIQLKKTLINFLFTPVDVHYVPFHRLITYIIYKLWPMNYAMAVTFLLGIHLLTVIILYKFLNKLGKTNFNIYLVFLYAVNIFSIVPLLWWSSALHRFPALLLTSVCLFNYAQYRNTRKTRNYIIIVLSFIFALGFYTKAVLIPFYILGIELCLIPQTDKRGTLQNLRVISSFFVISGVYVILYFVFRPESYDVFKSDIRLIFTFWGLSFLVFSHSPFSLVCKKGAVFCGTIISLIWAFGVILSIRKNKINILYWAGIVAIVGVNFLLVGASARLSYFGPTIAYCYRYYFEIMMPFIVFFYFVFKYSLSGTIKFNYKAVRYRAAVTIFFVGYFIISYRNATYLIDNQYPHFKKTKNYIQNFISDIDDLKMKISSHIFLIDKDIPPYINGLNSFNGFRKLSQLFSLYDFNLSFKDINKLNSTNFFVIDDDGHLQKIIKNGPVK